MRDFCLHVSAEICMNIPEFIILACNLSGKKDIVILEKKSKENNYGNW